MLATSIPSSSSPELSPNLPSRYPPTRTAHQHRVRTPRSPESVQVSEPQRSRPGLQRPNLVRIVKPDISNLSIDIRVLVRSEQTRREMPLGRPVFQTMPCDISIIYTETTASKKGTGSIVTLCYLHESPLFIAVGVLRETISQLEKNTLRLFYQLESPTVIEEVSQVAFQGEVKR